MLGVWAGAATGVALTYAVPALADLRPWTPGAPAPIVRRYLPGEAVVEGLPGEIGVVAAPPTVAVPAPTVAPSPRPPLPTRPPGVATALEDAGDRGLDPLYRALWALQGGDRDKVRVVHVGDSILAADGIASQVRARLQARFGDGGPGFLSAGMDPLWSKRVDLRPKRSGAWTTFTVLDGGAPHRRYGLGGMLGRAEDGAAMTFPAPKRGGQRIPFTRAEVWWQAAPGAGRWSVDVDGVAVAADTAAAAEVADRRTPVTGGRSLRVDVTGGPVGLYGVVLENDAGVVWDTLGVVGIGSHSLRKQDPAHLAAQVAAREPSLIAVMLGGNELGYDPVRAGDAAGYGPWLAEALGRLRAGAPDAGCLIVGPLDQGLLSGDRPQVRAGVSVVVDGQRALAAQLGCAFWDSRAAMGGPGAILRWSTGARPMAWADLVHLTRPGLDLVGDLLADAILSGYDGWVTDGGPGRPAPPPPVTPPVEAP